MADFDSRIDAPESLCRGQDCHRRHDHQRQLQCSGQRWPLLHHRQGKSALRTSAWMPISTLRPTATRLPSSSLWTRIQTTSSQWIVMQPLAPMAHSWHRRSGKRAGQEHRCLQEWPHRLSGTPECLVHRRGRHSGTERNAERSGKRTAVIFSQVKKKIVQHENSIFAICNPTMLQNDQKLIAMAAAVPQAGYAPERPAAGAGGYLHQCDLPV